jgi:cytochrome c oxidase accessory protein FixG
MEFVYRPLERLLEGSGRHKGGEISPGRRVLKYVVYLFVSAFLAHTFLSYFVGVDQLRVWITGSPSDHPAAFFVMLATTALMMFDFAVFREQTCLVACPYGRFQSVLLDRNSLIVGYDAKRGEPRGRAGERKRAGEGANFGDCIECGACVHTCPTGIDIRKGLQMECVHCTQCIDACDEIMVKIGKPKGLIRYSSKDELAGAPKRFLRPRTIAYPLLMALILGLFTIALASKQDTDVTILRGLSAPYTEIGPGQVSNQIRIKIVNRADEDRIYAIELLQADEATLIAPQNPLPVPAGKSAETSVFVTSPSTYFTKGRHEVVFRISDGKSFIEEEPYHLLGPQSDVDREKSLVLARFRHRSVGRDPGRQHRDAGGGGFGPLLRRREELLSEGSGLGQKAGAGRRERGARLVDSSGVDERSGRRSRYGPGRRSRKPADRGREGFGRGFSRGPFGCLAQRDPA